MKIYIAETGCYENKGFAGAFDTVERAMAALPGKKWERTLWLQISNNWSYYQRWQNDLDWDEAATITECEIVTEGDERPVDEIIQQRYRESDGNWDYVPISEEEASQLLDPSWRPPPQSVELAEARRKAILESWPSGKAAGR